MTSSITLHSLSFLSPFTLFSLPLSFGCQMIGICRVGNSTNASSHLAHFAFQISFFILFLPFYFSFILNSISKCFFLNTKIKMSSKLSSKWVVFGSCLLFFASGCVLYVLVMTRHFVDDEIEMADEGQKVDEGTAKWELPNESKQSGNLVGGDEQQKDQQKEKQQSKVLLLEQSMPNGNEVSSPDPRVHYEKSPDGRMKATMDITLHYQRQKVVSAAQGQ